MVLHFNPTGIKCIPCHLKETEKYRKMEWNAALTQGKTIKERNTILIITLTPKG